MGYAEIDADIRRWSDRHMLVVHDAWSGGELRHIYVSSDVGECFQIWIELPQFGLVLVHAAAVEYLRGEPPSAHWLATTPAIGKILEEAFTAVIAWMVPAKRPFPTSQNLE